MAERLLRWTFTIQLIAGAKNFGPDALSRSPGPSKPVGSLGTINQEAASWSEDLEGQIRATAESRRVLVVSWNLVKTAGVSDKSYASLIHALSQDSEPDWDSPDNMITEYKRYRNDMSTVDGVVLYKGRVVVP